MIFFEKKRFLFSIFFFYPSYQTYHKNIVVVCDYQIANPTSPLSQSPSSIARIFNYVSHLNI